jgi:hypothetical protein
MSDLIEDRIESALAGGVQNVWIFFFVVFGRQGRRTVFENPSGLGNVGIR